MNQTLWEPSHNLHLSSGAESENRLDCKFHGVALGGGGWEAFKACVCSSKTSMTQPLHGTSLVGSLTGLFACTHDCMRSQRCTHKLWQHGMWTANTGTHAHHEYAQWHMTHARELTSHVWAAVMSSEKDIIKDILWLKGWLGGCCRCTYGKCKKKAPFLIHSKRIRGCTWHCSLTFENRELIKRQRGQRQKRNIKKI